VTITSYVAPSDPADPEIAALELIVRLGAEITRTESFAALVQDYSSVLHLEGAFAGLAWCDAKNVAAAIVTDITQCDDPAARMGRRARMLLEGTDNAEWNDREASARALSIAATVLGS
jgi:hypothetical protein